MAYSMHLTMKSLGVLGMLLWCGVAGANADRVRLNQQDEKSFTLTTGDYIVRYAPREHPRNEGWITIAPVGAETYALATKCANGPSLDVTDAAQPNYYHWKRRRKNIDMFRGLICTDRPDRIDIIIETEKHWANFRTRLTAYKKYPGLLHWTVSATTKTDKAFDGGHQPDVFMFEDGKVKPRTLDRYSIQRGPAAGIAYAYDAKTNSTVFYFEDFSAMAKLYDLTQCANPFDGATVVGQTGAVKCGPVNEIFQPARSDNDEPLPPKPFEPVNVQVERFGYHRPASFRVPKGTSLSFTDTYLYLQPDKPADNVAMCKTFCHMLAHIYQFIYKPPTVVTDWAHKVVPQMAADILDDENWIEKDGEPFWPRAYPKYRHDVQELWTVGQLLAPLNAYVKKYPQHEAPRQLKARLDRCLPTFYDEEYKGFTSNLAPVHSQRYYHGVYIVNPLVQIAELALQDHPEAVRMLTGYRDRLLQMGHKCGYVFADPWLDDYSKQNFYYQFDNTCMYIYTMLTLNQLNDNQDVECVAAAQAAAEVLKARGFDLAYEVNSAATGTAALAWLAQVTQDEGYYDLAYIPLANTLRWAWLWECDYGVGEHTTTFWGFCATPSNPNSCEYESHQTRLMFKEYLRRAGVQLSPELTAMLTDAWKRGPTQSRFALPPYLIAAGAKDYLAAEGPMETDCGDILYNAMIPLEDVRGGWGTDIQWYDNNAQLGTVGQEIYGAGGPIWYALWQEELP